jgi:carboxyl-terminal processing protease
MTQRRIPPVLASLLAAAIVAWGAVACSPAQVDGGETVVPTAPPPSVPTGVPEDLAELWEVWETLQKDYVDPDTLDKEALTRGAIQGMLEALDDPYTAYVAPGHFEMQLEELEGSFEGIGIIVAERNERIVVVAPIHGSPAERAGLRAGDVLLAVDGLSTDGLDLGEVTDLIRGRSGTTVVLRVAPSDLAQTQEITIERTIVVVPSVTTEMLPGDIAHVTLASFASRTDEDLRQELEALRISGVSGIVLDLRNNPGGLVDTAIAVASEFLDGGVVHYEVGRSDEEVPREVRPGGLALDVPVTVLVNRGSASASEIVAGAMQARGRALVVGEKTFGKGSVTLLVRLSSGAGLYVTNTRWLTPDKEPIEGVGLTPDVTVTDDPATPEDEALLRAAGLLRR